MYKEDVDLGLRLGAAGWEVVVRSDLEVLHQRGTAGADWHKAPRWASRRSLANEWAIWRRGTLPMARRLSRSEEHTSELQSLMRISYAGFCLKKKNHDKHD